MNQHHHEDLACAALELAVLPEIQSYFPGLRSKRIQRILTRDSLQRQLLIHASSAPDRDQHIVIHLGYGLRDLSGVPGFGQFASFEHFAIRRGHIEDGTRRITGYSMTEDESLGDLDDWASMEVTVNGVDMGPLNRIEFIPSMAALPIQRKTPEQIGRAAHCVQDSCCWHHTVGYLLHGHSTWERRLWEHYRAWAHRGGELDVERIVPHVIGQLQDSMLTGERNGAAIIESNVSWVKGYMQEDWRRERAMEGRIEAETAQGVCARALAATLALMGM